MCCSPWDASLLFPTSNCFCICGKVCQNRNVELFDTPTLIYGIPTILTESPLPPFSPSLTRHLLLLLFEFKPSAQTNEKSLRLEMRVTLSRSAGRIVTRCCSHLRPGLQVGGIKDGQVPFQSQKTIPSLSRLPKNMPSDDKNTTPPLHPRWRWTTRDLTPKTVIFCEVVKDL